MTMSPLGKSFLAINPILEFGADIRSKKKIKTLSTDLDNDLKAPQLAERHPVYFVGGC